MNEQSKDAIIKFAVLLVIGGFSFGIGSMLSQFDDLRAIAAAHHGYTLLIMLGIFIISAIIVIGAITLMARQPQSRRLFRGPGSKPHSRGNSG